MTQVKNKTAIEYVKTALNACKGTHIKTKQKSIIAYIKTQLEAANG